MSASAGAVLVELLGGAYPGEKVVVADACRGAIVLPDSNGMRANPPAIAPYLDVYLLLWDVA